MIRKINRMPNDEFMMDVMGDGTAVKKKGTDASKSLTKLESTDDIDGLEEDLDDFFDFIMLDKAEVEAQMNNRLAKPNKQEKIEKEQEAMQETKGQLIAQHQGNTKADSKDEVKLEDFKIKKVIDKGSFGKVFLVVNTKTGRELAMKRINKDILIEKGQIINTKTEKDILF